MMISWLTLLLGYDPEREALQPYSKRQGKPAPPVKPISGLPENVTVNEITEKLELHQQTEDGSEEWSDYDPQADRPPRGSLELTQQEEVFFKTTNGYALETAALLKPKWSKWQGPKKASQELLKKYPKRRGIAYESCRRYWRIFNQLNAPPTEKHQNEIYYKRGGKHRATNPNSKP